MLYILSYELRDDPGTEHEVEIEATAHEEAVDRADAHLASMRDMLCWASLYDDDSNQVGALY